VSFAFGLCSASSSMEKQFLLEAFFSKTKILAQALVSLKGANMAPRGETPTDSDDEQVHEAQVATARFDTTLQTEGLD
jgi:hypothetical protein